ncbi:hypothetical protein GCM10023075_78640 [Streptosporangium album]
MAPPHPVRFPEELAAMVKAAARARHCSVNELVVTALARELGYDLNAKPPRVSEQKPIPLIDEQSHAAA